MEVPAVIILEAVEVVVEVWELQEERVQTAAAAAAGMMDKTVATEAQARSGTRHMAQVAAVGAQEIPTELDHRPEATAPSTAAAALARRMMRPAMAPKELLSLPILWQAAVLQCRPAGCGYLKILL